MSETDTWVRGDLVKRFLSLSASIIFWTVKKSRYKDQEDDCLFRY